MKLIASIVIGAFQNTLVFAGLHLVYKYDLGRRGRSLAEFGNRSSGRNTDNEDR